MKSFTIYEEYLDLITLLNENDAKDLLWAICEYMFYDKEPTLTEEQNKIFRNLKRPLNISKKQSIRSTGNGAPLGNQNALKNKPKTNQKQTEEKPKTNRKQTHQKMSMSMSMSNVNVYVNVINKLNELTNSKYNYKSKETQKLINGRLEEGYTEEDLIMVVEKMCYYWNKQKEKGGKDMTEYLRPSTLFRPTNFENYYNLKVSKSTNDFSNVDWSDF